MKKTLNISISNPAHNILADMYYNEQNTGALVLFCHGFKGFKDWGAWHLVAKDFAEAGFIFIKFNFSHNGIGKEDFKNLTRLDLFKKNNYSKEMEDVEVVLNWIGGESYKEKKLPAVKNIFILGHSRGGGIALLSAFENSKISKVATWASIANFDRFGNEEDLVQWKLEGQKNFYNSRTKQDMKIGFQFYQDFDKNRQRFDLEKAAKNLKQALLLVHGKKDEGVGFSHAQRIKTWQQNAELVLIEGANHVFGAQHPWIGTSLPVDLEKVVQETILFFKKH
jgi:uncharacterized protein